MLLQLQPPALGQHLLDIPKAQGEPEIEPNGQPDHVGRNLWRLKETGCMGIPPFGGLQCPKRRKFRVRLIAPTPDGRGREEGSVPPFVQTPNQVLYLFRRTRAVQKLPEKSAQQIR